MPIVGLMRVKNEARWIERSVRSIQAVCSEIIVLDDHSNDGTAEICESIGARVFRSEFEGLNETRDKDYLLEKAYENFSIASGNHLNSPHWALMIDGDEELYVQDVGTISELTQTADHVYSLRILFLWNDEQTVRIDGIYGRFRRPSLFRLIDRSYRFKQSGNGGNFHCASIPQEMRKLAKQSEARLLHYGYMSREDRIRKYNWYNEIDKDDAVEDFYRHIVIGDVFPANSKFKWAGPILLKSLDESLR